MISSDFWLPGPPWLGPICLLAALSWGRARRRPRLLPLQDLRPQQLLEFKNKVISSLHLSLKAQD